jgi:hypothetical protein
VATPVVGDDGVVLFRNQEPLLRHVTLASGSNLQRRGCPYVAVPVGLHAPSGEHHALPGSRVVEEYLQHRLAEQTALAPPVDQQEKPVTEQPPQVEAVEVDRQPKREPLDAPVGFDPSQGRCGSRVLETGASFTPPPSTVVGLLGSAP